MKLCTVDLFNPEQPFEEGWEIKTPRMQGHPRYIPVQDLPSGSDGDHMPLSPALGRELRSNVDGRLHTARFCQLSGDHFVIGKSNSGTDEDDSVLVLARNVVYATSWEWRANRKCSFQLHTISDPVCRICGIVCKGTESATTFFHPNAGYEYIWKHYSGFEGGVAIRKAWREQEQDNFDHFLIHLPLPISVPGELRLSNHKYPSNQDVSILWDGKLLKWGNYSNAITERGS